MEKFSTGGQVSSTGGREWPWFSTPWKKIRRVFHAMEDFRPPVEKSSTGGWEGSGFLGGALDEGGGGAGGVAQEAGAAGDVAEGSADAAGDFALGDAFAEEAEDGPAFLEGGVFGAGEEVGEDAAHFVGFADGAEGAEELGFGGFHVAWAWRSNCIW